MESTKCCICGKELPMNMTLIVINIGNGKYKYCCMKHEGTKELNIFMKIVKHQIKINSIMNNI